MHICRFLAQTPELRPFFLEHAGYFATEKAGFGEKKMKFATVDGRVRSLQLESYFTKDQTHSSSTSFQEFTNVTIDSNGDQVENGMSRKHILVDDRPYLSLHDTIRK